MALSSAQRRLWFLDRIKADVRDAYHLSGVLDFDGELGELALQRSVEALLARHEILRATFAEVDDEPVQHITPPAPFPLKLEDLQHLGARAMAQERERRVQEDCTAPFDLETGPLIRARLLRLGPTRHSLVLSLHHMVTDGWSIAVLMREVAVVYTAFAQGLQDPLPPLAAQYGDHVAEERERAASPMRATRLAYWQRQLEGAPELLELPTDRPRPPVQLHAGDHVEVVFPTSLLAALRHWAKECDATLPMALHAGLNVMLARLSGQQDIVIGAPTANRRRHVYREAVGYFVNTLALRTDLSDNPTANALLERVRSIGQAAYLRQDVPFDQIVELVRPARNPSHSPLFQVLMVMHNFDTDRIELPGATARLSEVPPQSVVCDLMLLFRETADGMVARIAYATALFDRPTIQRWAGYLLRLLEAMARDGTRRVAQLPMLGDGERSLLLEGFNAMRAAHGADTLVHTLFERQAMRTPAAVALVTPQRRWRYGELDARANRLARRLQSDGLGPGMRAALFIGRSADMIVAMLAVMKAGAAYVPLDPGDPPERIARILDDATPQIVITQKRLQAAIPGSQDRIFVLDAEPESEPQNEPPSTGVRSVDVRPHDAAYIIYTSGSTGRPKGVVLEHSALVNLIHWQARYREDDRAPRTLQYVALGFDVAFQEIFTTLCGGGTLVLIHEGVRRDMAALLRVLGEERIERLILPFVSLQHLAEESAISREPLPALKQVVTGAEQLRISAEIQSFFERHDGCRLQNQYGPTEYPVATALDLQGPAGSWPLLPSIGHPINNTVVRILDNLGQPVPIGVKGELYIGGAGMARGYLGEPELDRTAFIDDPFASGEGERLYKTGDFGRWRSDGSIDFVGRSDDQVKLRGFRIELGEIEVRIGQHPSVANVAVLLQEDDREQKQLAAYLTLAPGVAAPRIGAELKRHVRSLLPEYMIPSWFVVLDALPLTANGKVDRRALPPPAPATEGGERLLPRGPTEEMLWEIWRSVLHTSNFGVEDSFFDLGGHSLLTMQVASRIRQRSGLELPLALLFEHPTVAALAARLDENAPRASPASPSAIPRVARDKPMPASLSQRRMWVIQQFDPASVAYHVPVSLRLRGALDRSALQRAFDLVIQRHEGLRTHFTMHANEPVQHIAPSMAITIEQIDLRQHPAADRSQEARSILADRVSQPFDLTQPPLHRATLAILDDRDHVFLWNMHHAITDVWSIAILMREMLSLYATCLSGRPAQLPPLEIEYADYAAWQRSPAATAQRQHQIDFWIHRLRDMQPLNLPIDFARPLLPTFRGSRVSMSMSPALRERLRHFCGRQAVTPYVVLLSAFKLMLSRYCDSLDIAVGTPIANRHHLATEQLVGTLVNTLVMRTDLAGNPDFVELVKRVRKTALEAYAHQDAPFDEIVELLEQDRRTHPEGLVRTLFNVPNAPLGDLPRTDFTYEEFELGSTAAQFDLSIHVDTEFGHRIHVEYSTDLFAPVSAERMLANYVALLEQVLSDEHRPISDYPILAPAQLALMRDDWNATQAFLDPHPLIHEHLRCRERALHDRIAIIDSHGNRTTYGELDASSDRLASALRAMGFGRGDRIGLSVPRDAGMLVALLAVLKAGAAYVPLDPAFPVDRLSYMASDAELSAILTGPETASLFEATGVPLLDPTALLKAAIPPQTPWRPDPDRDAQPLDPAYFIYTSGSTGRPKAVGVPHRAVVNFLVAMAKEPGLEPSDRLVAVTTLSFDIAVLELLLPLSVGAQVIIADSNHVDDPRQLRSMLERYDATVMQATPSAWRALLDSGWIGGPKFRALIGGEPLQAVLAEQLLDRCAELWNMYGPTETTVWSTRWKVHAPRQGISIGRPIANTSVWVLDANGLPCPIGASGELCIGGWGVALGYHDREALTAGRFVVDPWSDEPGARLYRTGDLCRWRHDGLLEHLGRLDHQVKVRGFRIELGEIEAVLLDHPAVARCIVVTRAEREDDVRLVAYVVAGSSEVHIASLREHLQAALPDYMVPQHLVVLKTMPLLPNGKVDRNALPAPNVEASRTRRDDRQPPTTAEEKVIAEIWSELLGVEVIERTDNFFELGGHSLLAMRAVVAAKQRLGLDIAPRRLVFETLRQVANRESANKT